MNKLFSYLHTKSREEKFRLFVKLLKPTPSMRILNVGASGPNRAFAEQFESLYEHPNQVTGGGISLSEVQDYQHSFPGVKTLVFDGCALPFRDKSFDVVYSNAVIEHLADRYAQQRFAAEVVRVGKGWFVTTPNLYYPVEPHYHLPLVQFLPQRWQRSLVEALGRTPYENLNLLTKQQLQRLLPDGDVIGCRVTFYPETLIAYRPPELGS
jgi:2-polyprenyl-3-methyl-5-hydroxy-6-metoxy-1,4-benzoquinol methylase